MISLFILLCFMVFINSCNILYMYLYFVRNKDPLLLVLLLQSAYEKVHSTETALLKVQNDY